MVLMRKTQDVCEADEAWWVNAHTDGVFMFANHFPKKTETLASEQIDQTQLLSTVAHFISPHSSADIVTLTYVYCSHWVTICSRVLFSSTDKGCVSVQGAASFERWNGLGRIATLNSFKL